jgi:NADPH:quinone reductase-like Zn-dependent oxidoreductase
MTGTKFMPSGTRTCAQLRSCITSDGRLELHFARGETQALGEDEVLVEIEAAPINPSDMGLLFGVSSMPDLQFSGEGLDRRATAQLAETVVPYFSGRFGLDLPTGLEGCGIVVETGSSPEAKALAGCRVSTSGSGMFATHCVVKAEECLPLPADISSAEGASAFINPLTALGMVETAKAAHHSAMIFTAAASNLGRMVHRVCEDEGIGFIGVVRGVAHVEQLRAAGVRYACDLTSPDFSEQLIEAITANGATVAFDGIGGGGIVNELLRCMEVVASREMKVYSRYGSTKPKHVYIYGGLDPSPVILKRDFGFSFGISGWLLFNWLDTISWEQRKSLLSKVAAKLQTTFATDYAVTISLEDVLRPESITAYMGRSTGGKYLVAPNGLSRAR